MKKYYCFLAITWMALFSACSPSTEGTRYIPKDAIAVMNVNGSKLGTKIAWDLLFSGDWFKKSHHDDKSNEKDKIGLDQSGIDLMSNFYCYALPDQRLQNGSVKIVAIVPLNSRTKWEAFLKDNFSGIAIKNENKISIANLNENMVAGWNGKTAIVAMTPQSRYGTNFSSDNAVAGILHQEVLDAFNIDKSENITKNDKFALLQQEHYDVSLWVNYERMTQSMPVGQMGPASMIAGQSSFTKDAYLLAGANFDKGRITGEFKYYPNPSMAGIMKQLIADKYDDDLLKRLPGGQLAAVLSYHINPQGIRSMLDTMGTTAIINDEIQDDGLSVQGLLDIFTGDILCAVTDVKMETKTQSYTISGETQTYTYKDPSANWMVAFKIKNQPSLDKLIQLGLQNGMISVVGDNLFQVPNTKVLLSEKNGYALITANQDDLNTFYAGNSNAMQSLPDDIKNNPMYLYIDARQLANIYAGPDAGNDPDEAALHNEMKNLLEKIVGYGGKMEGDHSSFRLNIDFTNKSDNSLMQILKLAGKVRKLQDKEDTATLPIPDTAVVY